MKIVDTIDNGNVALDNIISQNNTNRSWSETSSANYRQATSVDTNKFVSNDFIDNQNCNTENKYEGKPESKICNRQYNLNNNANLRESLNVTNLDKDRQTKTKWKDAVDAKYSSKKQFIGEESGFDNSDSDEMSENSVQNVPRGIVNPNYPGFQHLAHTLQDYSSNIEQFYHSENDMTDDDLDVEITPETTFDINEQLDDKYINNNNENDTSVSNNPFTSDSLKQSNTQNDIPDLLKTVTFNNNNDSVQYEFNNCSTTDIENNFRAKDIIGDFNKEVEDEIRQVLNYNINIEDDLEELRRDIKDTFAKPIENTLNNISDVVNHVIKKLVESDECDRSDASTPDIIIDHEMEDISNMNRENETNSRTELSISRPTFLLLSNKDTIKDAILSDGKEEININIDEYDTEHLSHNVENTIKQLSTELRKIIPKLNEMRERDKLWIDNSKEAPVTDGNSNTVVQGSSVSTCDTSSCSQDNGGSNGRKIHNISTINPRSVRAHIESKLRQNAKKTLPKGPKNLSVRNDNHNESDLECFDVYNIETALPKLDLDAIENHIRAAKEAERRKRNDREEIRKRLAMGGDTEDYYSLGHTDRPGKKPSLHSRLQNGKNLQICFMNETASDNESQASDLEHSFSCNSKSSSRSSIFSRNSYNHPYQTRPLSVNITKHEKSNPPSGAKLRPTSLMLKTSKSRSSHSLGHIELKESDFYALQATLQTEARIALAQAKEMARIQMERERRSRPVSPVTDMLRRSMEKASAPLAPDRRRVSRHLLTDMNIAQLQRERRSRPVSPVTDMLRRSMEKASAPLAPDRRRVSRHLLTDMNIAQLQVIVNELHSQIESLNDALVQLLMARDELHMGQDSMLVDIEDLTRYLGVREQTKKTKGNQKSGVKRLTSLVHK